MIENTDELPSLPNSWAWTRLEEIGIVASGGTPSTSVPEYFEGDVPWITPADLSSFTGKFIQRGRRNISEKGLHSSSAVLLPAGTILFSSRAPIGYVAIAANPIATNQGFKNLVLCEGVFNEYVFHYLKASKKLAESYGSGTTFREVSASRFRPIPIPLAPYNEQRRIVVRLEELFACLDAGVEGLRKVKAQLKRYRQAVLKYAFEGKLTEEWRKTHKHLIEPAIELLEQIRQQRKEKVGKKSKELPPVDLSDLPALPESWKWIRLGDIAERMQYGTSEKASKEPSGIPVLRMGNIQEGSLVCDNLKYFPEDWSRLSEFLLSDGDVLFNRTNSAELVGKTAVYREHHPKATFASYLIRVQTSKTAYMPELLSFFINSLYGRKYILSVVSQQVGQANVNGTKLSLMPIPLIPYQEQIVIQQEIERCFSVADELGKSTGQSLRQAELLHQSILKMAFEGKLVSQDPTDEPADQLLARIEGVKIENENTDENKPKELGLMRYVK